MEALPLAGPNKVDRKGLKARARELWREPENAGADRFLDHHGTIVLDLRQGRRGGSTWVALSPVSRQRGAVPGRDGKPVGHRQPLRDPAARPTSNSSASSIPRRSTRGRGSSHATRACTCSRCACRMRTRATRQLSARTDTLLAPVQRERMLDVDGEPRTMRFRNIFSRDESWTEARYIVIEHQTPEYLWQPRYQPHPNGACELVAVTFVADDPTTLTSRTKHAKTQAQDRRAAWRLDQYGSDSQPRPFRGKRRGGRVRHDARKLTPR